MLPLYARSGGSSSGGSGGGVTGLIRTIGRNRFGFVLALAALISLSGILLFANSDIDSTPTMQSVRGPGQYADQKPGTEQLPREKRPVAPKPQPLVPGIPGIPEFTKPAEEQQQPQQQLSPTEFDVDADPATMALRQRAVKAAMEHAWGGYAKHAWGTDEVRPVTKQSTNWLGLGATIVDSLDTLWIMGMHDQFAKARDWVASSLRFDISRDVSFFETTIRVLGGLLSAYDLSGEEVFLKKAKDIADRLAPAFNTHSGVPHTTINLKSGSSHNPGWAGGSTILAEVGTVQLEFLYLSIKTGDRSYGEKALHVLDVLDEKNTDRNGLLPVYIDSNSGRCTGGPVTLGALGDSYFEYLLKLWVFLGKDSAAGAKYRTMYDRSADAIIKHMVQKSTPSELTYIAEKNGQSLRHNMDHLACFAGAMFALGAAARNATSEGGPNHNHAEHFAVGAEITRTCHEMYARMASGVAPEFITFFSGNDFQAGAAHNLLRPEAVESFFVLWRLTHNPIYQRWGWEAFQAFEKHCRAEAGYSGLTDVRSSSPGKDNSQPSYFLAETLKYLYLLFSPDDVIPLDRYVFNTEAHPLSIQSNAW